MQAAIIKAIIEQHAEESASLWLQRNAAVAEPHYFFKDLAHIDDRVDAHIDDIRVAGNEGWDISKEVLTFEEACGVFTATIFAFEKGNKDWIQTVLKAGEKSYGLSRGIVSALGWIGSREKPMTYAQARTNAIAAHSANFAGCNPDCIKEQLDNYHTQEELGVKDDDLLTSPSAGWPKLEKIINDPKNSEIIQKTLDALEKLKQQASNAAIAATSL